MEQERSVFVILTEAVENIERLQREWLYGEHADNTIEDEAFEQYRVACLEAQLCLHLDCYHPVIKARRRARPETHCSEHQLGRI